MVILGWQFEAERGDEFVIAKLVLAMTFMGTYLPILHTHDSGWVSTDKATYVEGDQGRLMFLNPSASDVGLPSLSPWRITDVTGIVAYYGPAQLPAYDTVHPMESRSWAFQLRDQGGYQLGPGTYRAEVTLWDHGELRTRESFFEICTPTRSIPWGAPDLVYSSVECSQLH